MIILHGEYTLTSYQALLDEKKKHEGKEIVILNGDGITKADIELAIAANTLFSDDKLIIIEGLLTSRPGKRKEEVMEFLKSISHADIILYEDKEATTANLKKFPRSKIVNFKPPQSIFTFVDGISPVDPKRSVQRLHELLLNEPAEIIYIMIVRQFRNMILAKEGNPKYFGSLQPWMLNKFRSQARYFSMDELIVNYRKLLDIDYKIKSGLTPLPLSKLLDIFILTL